jgi:hypothetical protein
MMLAIGGSMRVASGTKQSTATSHEVGDFVQKPRTLFLPRKTDDGWTCDSWVLKPRGERLIGPIRDYRPRCNFKNSPLVRVEWEYGLTETILGITPLYFHEDGGMIASSHVRFFQVVRVEENSLELIEAQGPDERSVTYHVSAVRRWYRSASACEDASKRAPPEVLRSSGDSLLPPSCCLTCR